MNGIVKKAKDELMQCYKVEKYFGKKYGIAAFLNKFICRNERLFGGFKEWYYSIIREYLQDKYYLKISYNQNSKTEKIRKDSPVWIMWWQGEKNMPDLVKACISSVSHHMPTHRINIITESNYMEYITIPQYIIQKFYEGCFGVAHLSDIIRFSLLSKYGGFWIDATIFMTEDINEQVYSYSLYSINHGKSKYLCNGLWSAFFWAGEKGNPFFEYVLNFFYEYWKDSNILIDYFLIDCVIKIAYERDTKIKRQIDKIPRNNSDVLSLEKKLNKKYNIDAFFGGTYIYKFSWKRKYKVKTFFDNRTIYSHIISSTDLKKGDS